MVLLLILLTQLEVVRPEVVPPLRHAVRLVHHKVGQLPELDKLLQQSLQERSH
jgi:hypothetical protein